jgi:hypothetical protein
MKAKTHARCRNCQRLQARLHALQNQVDALLVEGVTDEQFVRQVVKRFRFPFTV